MIYKYKESNFLHQEEELLCKLWMNFQESNLLDLFQIYFIEKFLRRIKLTGWLWIGNVKNVYGKEISFF